MAARSAKGGKLSADRDGAPAAGSGSPDTSSLSHQDDSPVSGLQHHEVIRGQDVPFCPDNGVAPGHAYTSNERDKLRLMHHYTLFTYKSIAAAPEALDIWQNLIPQLAFEYDFLLQGILAATSLHLALTDSSHQETHSGLALQYYITASALFRPHLTSITPSNISALFAFSCIVPVCAFGFPQIPYLPINPLPEIHETIVLLRGTADIVRSGSHWLECGPFKHLLLPEPSSPCGALPMEIEAALLGLSKRNDETTTDAALRNAYCMAITTLRHTFRLAGEAPGKANTALLFPIQIPPEIPVKIRDGEPMALSILAHYAVVLHWLNSFIWLRRWGRQVVNAVEAAVGEEWRGCIAWAIEEVKNDTTKV
ncbi:MAG: hypothetical protein M1830_005558 [Pleopsidium flavum]|nr:MAG: hypothetical protein M1830_005558 [Pleopsidium flavum]